MSIDLRRRGTGGAASFGVLRCTGTGGGASTDPLRRGTGGGASASWSAGFCRRTGTAGGASAVASGGATAFFFFGATGGFCGGTASAGSADGGGAAGFFLTRFFGTEGGAALPGGAGACPLADLICGQTMRGMRVSYAATGTPLEASPPSATALHTHALPRSSACALGSVCALHARRQRVQR